MAQAHPMHERGSMELRDASYAPSLLPPRATPVAHEREGQQVGSWRVDPAQLKHSAPKGRDGDSEIEGGWATCLEEMLRYDKKMIEDWNDEINTILIFAGLFSAVLTAFTVESYQMLQQDPEQASAVTLSQISLQLESFSVNPAFINSTYIPSPRTTSIAEAATRINSLWFTSLVLSLTSALTAIFARQWLREYVPWHLAIPKEKHLSSPRETVRLRQFRHDGLVRWRVPAVMNAISIFLQMAVVLFLAGLTEFVWTLNRIVAITITVFIAAPLFLLLASAIIPTFAPGCPYKSPLAYFIYRVSVLILWLIGRIASLSVAIPLPKSLRGDTIVAIRRRLEHLRGRALRERMPSTWVLRDVLNVRHRSPEDLDSDSGALDWIHAYTFHEGMRDSILAECLSDIPSDKRARVVVKLVATASGYRFDELLRHIRLTGSAPQLSELKARIHMELLLAAYTDSCPCVDPKCGKVSRNDIHILTEHLSPASPETRRAHWRFLKSRIISGGLLSPTEICSFALGIDAALEESLPIPREDMCIVLRWSASLSPPLINDTERSAIETKAFDTAISATFRLLETINPDDNSHLTKENPDLQTHFFNNVNVYVLDRLERCISGHDAWRCPAQWIVFALSVPSVPHYFALTFRSVVLMQIYDPSEDVRMKLAIEKASVPLYLWDQEFHELSARALTVLALTVLTLHNVLKV